MSYFYLSIFVVIASVGTAIALMSFVYTVFLNFVFPPLLGPVLQGVAVLAEILGAQMIIQENTKYKRVYIAIGLLIALVAFTVAAKHLKISLIGIRGYMLVGSLVVAVLLALSVRVSSISRCPVRVISGVMIMLCGMTVPALIAVFFARDLL